MTNKELHNESMAKTIWHDALQCSMKPFSWGLNFNDIKVIDGGIYRVVALLFMCLERLQVGLRYSTNAA